MSHAFAGQRFSEKRVDDYETCDMRIDAARDLGADRPWGFIASTSISQAPRCFGQVIFADAATEVAGGFATGRSVRGVVTVNRIRRGERADRREDFPRPRAPPRGSGHYVSAPSQDALWLSSHRSPDRAVPATITSAVAQTTTATI
jgi:hypothetical protein